MNLKMSKSVNLLNVRSYNSNVNKIDYTYNKETYTPNSNSQENIENEYLETENIETNENIQTVPVEEAMNRGLEQNRNNVTDIFENNEIASNAAMAAGGFANGVGNFGENVVDAGVTGVTVMATPFTFLYDQFTGSNVTEEMWNSSNAFVEEEHVNNAFEDFYTNNEIGQAMNENASEAMQYGNTGYNTAVGVGYLTATVASAGTLSHVSSLGMASSGAAISGAAGFGRGTSDALNNGATTQEALVAGGLTGLWEGGQWIFGAKIAGNGLTTVALDAGSGAVDPLARSGIQMIYNDQSFAETFEQNGGVEGMLSNAAIAGGFSAIGEISTIRSNKVSENTTPLKTNYENASDFFEEARGQNNNYGVDQGVFKKLKPSDEAYKNVRSYLSDMGFSRKDTLEIMRNIDSTGVCSYAEFANEIMNTYKNSPAEFERIFGYPMYTSSGQLNDSQLLMDLYVFANNTDNGGRLFQPQGDTIKIIDHETSNQSYYWHGLSSEKNTSLINSFLQSKDPNLTYEVEYLGHRSESSIGNNFDMATGEPVLDNFDGMTGERILYDTNSLKERVDAALSNNQNVGMTIWQPNHTDHITLHGMADGVKDVSTAQWNEGDGHAIFVTGTNDQGIIVSSWGNQYRIDWKDLEFSQFSISSSTIK